MSWRQRLFGELAALFNLFLPPLCPLCAAALPEFSGRTLCPGCLADIQPVTSPCCPRCALPYPTENGTDHCCAACLLSAPPFQWVRAAGLHDRTLRQAVHRFKFGGAVDLDRPLALLLQTALRADLERFRPDLLIPVPLHRLRLRERTYNQSLLLCRQLAGLAGIPVQAARLQRIRATQPQPGLGAEARKQNLRGAFALSRPLSGERILLVDDVMTTGATARECSRTLLAGGASAVTVAVVARAPRFLLPGGSGENG